ncbi:MAG: hypothetical protein KJO80_00490 [Gammaproteobacteria bacterium]|nr:hypothetical protein [Gammaproteobacteria bacterium]
MPAHANNAPEIVVTAVESNTPVGLTMEQSAAAIRAGIAGFREWTGYMPIAREFDVGDEPIKVASHGLVTSLDWDRLFDLVFDPLTKLVEDSGLGRKELASGGLYFALPANDKVIAKCNLRRHFLDQVNERLALPKTKEFLGVQTGSTGVYVLIERAMEKMRAGEMDFCLIAAVDSYLLEGRLPIYDEQWRLKTDRNPAGYIPGEAGVVLLLETEVFARQRNAPVLLRIDGVGSGKEPNPVTGAKTSTGHGLSQAITSLAEITGYDQPWQWVMSDLNGERYKAYEWGVALPRLNALIHDKHEFSYIAECIGDTGAAVAAIQVGCASEAFKRGYAPAEAALLFAGNDAGNRCALSVSRK